MNTPAHVVLNLALLPRGRWAASALAVICGALLPDLLMFVFYGYQKFLIGMPEDQIWSRAYYQPAWQAVFDIFNSIPLIALLALAGLWLRSLFVEALALSMLLHCVLDFPLHNDDAHRHFYPFSDWRFESPVSYWDSRFYGDVFVFVELLLVVIASIAVLRSAMARWTKVTALSLALLYLAFLGFAWYYWAG